MPFLANDRLDPKLSHGDISIIFEAGHNDTVQFALRQLMRRTRSDLALRWMIDGYARGIGAGQASEAATPRNLLGFKDGTANLDVDDGGADGSPRLGATRRRRTRMGGRRFVSGRAHHPDVRRVLGPHPARRAGDAHRPQARSAAHRSGLTGEFADPDYAADPDGKRIPLDAHIRLANPRTPETDEEPASCDADSTTRADSTAQAGSTRGWRSSPTSAACRRASSPCRTG